MRHLEFLFPHVKSVLMFSSGHSATHPTKYLSKKHCQLNKPGRRSCEFKYINSFDKCISSCHHWLLLQYCRQIDKQNYYTVFMWVCCCNHCFNVSLPLHKILSTSPADARTFVLSGLSCFSHLFYARRHRFDQKPSSYEAIMTHILQQHHKPIDWLFLPKKFVPLVLVQIMFIRLCSLDYNTLLIFCWTAESRVKMWSCLALLIRKYNYRLLVQAIKYEKRKDYQTYFLRIRNFHLNILYFRVEVRH